MTMVPGADGGGSGVGSGSGVAFSVSFAPAPGSAGSCSSCFHPSTPLGPKACSQAQKISDNVKHFPSPIVTTKTHLPIRSTSSLSHGELKLSRKTFLQVFGVLFQLCVCVWRIFFTAKHLADKKWSTKETHLRRANILPTSLVVLRLVLTTIVSTNGSQSSFSLHKSSDYRHCLGRSVELIITDRVKRRQVSFGWCDKEIENFSYFLCRPLLLMLLFSRNRGSSPWFWFPHHRCTEATGEGVVFHISLPSAKMKNPNSRVPSS